MIPLQSHHTTPNRDLLHDTNRFRGLWVALATPFTEDGALDLEALASLVRHTVSGGVQGLVALGSTGEAATLDSAERDSVVAVCLEAAGDVPVIAGTGSNDTRQAVAYTRRAVELGADGALVVTPYYNKPNPDGLVAHFAAIAESAPTLPLVIYNVPGRTGQNLAPRVLSRLWQIDTAVAIKESSGDVGQIGRIARDLPDGKVLLAGDDDLALPAIAVGAEGLVSVTGNLLPSRMRQLVEAARTGQRDLARHLHDDLAPIFDALFAESNPVPLKAALSMLGLASDSVRPPLARASSETRLHLARVLDDLDVVAA